MITDGAEANDKQTNHPLHCAVKNQVSMELVPALLEACPGAAAAKDKHTRALHSYRRHSDPLFCVIVIRRGVNVLNSKLSTNFFTTYLKQ